MIKKVKCILFSLILLIVCINVNAMTKDDIINLASSINTCSSSTDSIVSSFKVTYKRLLDERDVSESNLNKIYNNISYVKNTLEKYNVCSKEDTSKLPSDVKNELYSLYKETNKIITSSPKHVDGVEESSEKQNIKETSGELKIVIDSSSNEIKLYEGESLINVASGTTKLNYVGINKIIIYLCFIIVGILIFMIIQVLKGKKNILITSFIYSLVFSLIFIVLFRNYLSIGFDLIQNMHINNMVEKNVVVKDQKIISYPSYGNNYAKININGNAENVYFGDSAELLSKGIGQKADSSFPGEDSTTILSGHNTGIFSQLFSLEKGNQVIIETNYGKFTYMVEEVKVINDTDIKELNKSYDLITYTCYPLTNLYGNKRLVVYYNLINSEWLGDNNEK